MAGATQLRLLLYGAVALTLAGGVAAYVLTRPRAEPVRVIPEATPTVPAELVVYVSGAVARPGIYTAREGDRFAHAIERAGGATSEADLEHINLATRLRDGLQVHVPRRSEPGGPVTVGGAPAKLSLSAASAAELETLPGIGPVLAQRIVAHRQANGPFVAIEDVQQVSGINRSVFEKIQDLVVP